MRRGSARQTSGRSRCDPVQRRHRDGQPIGRSGDAIAASIANLSAKACASRPPAMLDHHPRDCREYAPPCPSVGAKPTSARCCESSVEFDARAVRPRPSRPRLCEHQQDSQQDADADPSAAGRCLPQSAHALADDRPQACRSSPAARLRSRSLGPLPRSAGVARRLEIQPNVRAPQLPITGLAVRRCRRAAGELC